MDCLATQIEYNIESCVAGVASDDCVDSKRVSLSMPTGGDVIYGAAHQHTGGIGSALYGEVTFPFPVLNFCTVFIVLTFI